MKEYTFDEITVGLSESFSVQVTKEMQDCFTHITGDVNPMHIDCAYAQSKGFDGCLVYGMLTASFYSTLVGVYLPGKECLFYSCDTLFNKPVYINDVLEISGTVIEKETVPRKRIVVRAIIRNQRREAVSRAKLLVGWEGGV